MRHKNHSGLLMAAAIGGGLYWASKQPGGIKGTMNRLGGKLKEIQDSPHPLNAVKEQFASWQNNRGIADAAPRPITMDSVY
jgi:hypothetical protein